MLRLRDDGLMVRAGESVGQAGELGAGGTDFQWSGFRVFVT
jgi:hypothetical protein